MVLTGREKATIFLSILGADVSARVLRYLPDELADLIAAGINHLPSPSTDALSEVLDEYQSFLALPGAAAEALPTHPPAPKKSYSFLFYERPQTVAFLLSLLPDEERREALNSFPRGKAMVEELLLTLRQNPLRPKLESRLRQVFTGRLF